MDEKKVEAKLSAYIDVSINGQKVVYPIEVARELYKELAAALDQAEADQSLKAVGHG